MRHIGIALLGVVLLLAVLVVWRWQHEQPTALPPPAVTTLPQATEATPAASGIVPEVAQPAGPDAGQREKALALAHAPLSGPLAVTLPSADFMVPDGWQGLAGEAAWQWASVAGPLLSGITSTPKSLLILWPKGQTYAAAGRRLMVHVLPAEGVSAQQAVRSVAKALTKPSQTAPESTLLVGLLANELPIPALSWQVEALGFGAQAVLPWRDGEELLFLTVFAPDQSGAIQLLRENLTSLVETNKLAVAEKGP